MPLYNENRGVITHGCKTSHGGVVQIPQRTYTDMGKSVALDGDLVHCPQCKGDYPIIARDPQRTSNGVAVAFHGDTTACGATLISDLSIKPSTANVDTAEHPVEPTPTRYDQFFSALDETGLPITGFAYGIRTSAGEHHDQLYEDGATAKAYSQESKEVELLYLVQTDIGIRS